MSITDIANTLSQEFAATVAAAEANDRAELQGILNEFGALHLKYLQETQKVQEEYEIGIRDFLTRLCDIRDRKTAPKLALRHKTR